MVLGRQGMVCTGQPLATLAGVQMLRDGGNALDAAITAAATLGVVEPLMTGIGGDCFMLIWRADEQRLYGLNGSGRAPRAVTQAAMVAGGHTAMPMRGIQSITVPGAVDAWCEALERCGTRSLARVLEPAIDYAENGFAVSEVIAAQWQRTFGFLQTPEALRTFSIDGRAPRVGEVMHAPELARSLRSIATGGRDVLYRGELARAMAAYSRAHGGWLEEGDLAEHTSTWVDPISVDYRGVRLYELPPNGQGLAALLALNILECFELGDLSGALEQAVHLQVEAVKLAYADRNRWLADPDYASIPVAALLSKDYAQGRAALIRPDRALRRVAPGAPASFDTVYVTAADRWGNVVSLINSLYMAFGSGMVVDDTGILLQNRGFGFSLDPAHPNCLAPGKRPFHTIIPAMLMRDGRPLVSFGVIGGDMQAQGHMQLVSQLIDGQRNLQDAIEQPRFNLLPTGRVALETPLAEAVGAALARRGHDVADEAAAVLHGGFGGAQAIAVDPLTGVYWGASDPRRDGCAIGY